jgi:hypothetical protein
MGHAKEEEVGPERFRRSLPAAIMRLDEHANNACELVDDAQPQPPRAPRPADFATNLADRDHSATTEEP